MVPRAVAFTIVWPEGVIFGSIMTYHVQFLLLVRQPLFDRAALPLTQTAYSSHRERRIQSKLNSESGEAERSSKR